MESGNVNFAVKILAVLSAEFRIAVGFFLSCFLYVSFISERPVS
jgi:hypothetical protein